MDQSQVSESAHKTGQHRGHHSVARKEKGIRAAGTENARGARARQRQPGACLGLKTTDHERMSETL